LALRSLQLNKKTGRISANKSCATTAWTEYAKTLIIRQQGRLSQAMPKADKRIAQTKD
jgi:hypothetical protein